MLRYLIDGYNLLFHFPISKTLTLEMKREKIISFLLEISSLFRIQMILVFDATKKNILESTKNHIDSLEIVYTAANQTADTYILDELETSRNPKTYVVVTSDQRLAKHCQTLSAKTISVKEFLSLLEKRYQKKQTLEFCEKPMEEIDMQKSRLENIFEKKLSSKKKS